MVVVSVLEFVWCSGPKPKSISRQPETKTRQRAACNHDFFRDGIIFKACQVNTEYRERCLVSQRQRCDVAWACGGWRRRWVRFETTALVQLFSMNISIYILRKQNKQSNKIHQTSHTQHHILCQASHYKKATAGIKGYTTEDWFCVRRVGTLQLNGICSFKNTLRQREKWVRIDALNDKTLPRIHHCKWCAVQTLRWSSERHWKTPTARPLVRVHALEITLVIMVVKNKTKS
jgi:hypothetical protein